MSTPTKPSTSSLQPGAYRFIYWLDCNDDGVLQEVAVMREFENGDVYYFPMAAMDMIDKVRLRAIITKKTAAMFDELWQLLEGQVLGNGVNALLYFNQLVRVKTQSGVIMPFGSNNRGVSQPAEQTQSATPSKAAKA